MLASGIHYVYIQITWHDEDEYITNQYVYKFQES